jgi:SAM-dependent methyltransferase
MTLEQAAIARERVSIDTPDPEAIRRAYDGSTATFRALHALGWGPLLNFGYFRVLELPLLLFGLDPFLRRLAKNSIRLLAPKRGEHVLDVACGQGWTTRKIAARGAHAYGIDLIERHVELARERFGSHPGVRFEAGDATDLGALAEGFGLGADSVDKVHCLQAAFQFGAAGRKQFLSETFRLLRPGGRLVLVDFTWRTDRPEEIEDLDPGRLIRDTWRYEEFEPFERYRTTARDLGFREVEILDWSRPVIDRFQAACAAVSTLGQYRVPRALLQLVRPGLAKVSPEEWPGLAEVTRAHDRVRRQTRYAAFVLEKPGR